MNSRSESNILKILIFYSLTRQREIIDDNVKARNITSIYNK